MRESWEADLYKTPHPNSPKAYCAPCKGFRGFSFATPEPTCQQCGAAHVVPERPDHSAWLKKMKAGAR